MALGRQKEGVNRAADQAAQVQPTLADQILIARVLPGPDTESIYPSNYLSELAFSQLTTPGTWRGLNRQSTANGVIRGLTTRCLDVVRNHRPPQHQDPVVGMSYRIGCDGEKLSGFTLVDLLLEPRLSPRRLVTIRPGDFNTEDGLRHYAIEAGSALQVLAIDAPNKRIWVRYDSCDGRWDDRFAPPGIIANISFERLDRLFEAGIAARGREQALNELISDYSNGLERIQIRGRFFGIGDQIEMPLLNTTLYKVRVLNSPARPARSIQIAISTSRNYTNEPCSEAEVSGHLNNYVRNDLFWCGSGTPPCEGIDSAMNRATIMSFSRDGTVALLHLDRPPDLTRPCLALQEGALFPVLTRTGLLSGSARWCYGLLQDRYLRPWYIRRPTASTIMPALDRCRIVNSADFYDYGPGGD